MRINGVCVLLTPQLMQNFRFEISQLLFLVVEENLQKKIRSFQFTPADEFQICWRANNFLINKILTCEFKKQGYASCQNVKNKCNFEKLTPILVKYNC